MGNASSQRTIRNSPLWWKTVTVCRCPFTRFNNSTVQNHIGIGALSTCAGQGDGHRARKVKAHDTARPEVTPNVSATSPSSQDDEINMSWNMEYVPYMMRLEYRRRYPDLDEEMAELEKTHTLEHRHFYSAMLESLKEMHREQNPDHPDSDAQAEAEYDAYMAAHPGLKEKLIREEEEERAATMYSEAQIEELFSNSRD